MHSQLFAVAVVVALARADDSGNDGCPDVKVMAVKCGEKTRESVADCLFCLQTQFPSCEGVSKVGSTAARFCEHPLPDCVCMDSFTHQYQWKGTEVSPCEVDHDCPFDTFCRKPTGWDHVCGAVPTPEPEDPGMHEENGDAFGVVDATQVVGSKETGVPGYTTFRLNLKLGNDAKSVFTIFGNKEFPMIFPPAWHQTFAGVHIGGVSPVFFGSREPDDPRRYAEFDSVRLCSSSSVFHSDIQSVRPYAPTRFTGSRFADSG